MTRALGLVVAGALSACGAGTSAPPTDASNAIEGAADVGADAPGDAATLTVRVVALQIDGTSTPSPDTQVSFERPDGTRQELVTDASGVVAFTRVDPTAAAGTLTAYRAGYTLASRANVVARSQTVELPFFAIPRTVHLRGTLRNLRAGAVRNTVNTSGASGGRTTGAMFDANAPLGAPFQLVISEGAQGAMLPSGRGFSAPAPLRWSELAHGALQADAREDIDLATTRPLTPTSFRATYSAPVPLAAQLSSNAVAFSVVVTLPGGMVSTYSSIDRPRPDGPFEFTGEFVRPTGVERFMTAHVITVDGNNGGAGRSTIIEDGVPRPAASIANFLPLPTLGDVPFPTTAHAAVQVRERAPGVPVHGVIARGDDVLWYIDIGATGTTVRFPALPSRAAADPALRGEGLTLFVRSCEPDPRSFLCRRMAATEIIDLAGSL